VDKLPGVAARSCLRLPGLYHVCVLSGELAFASWRGCSCPGRVAARHGAPMRRQAHRHGARFASGPRPSCVAAATGAAVAEGLKRVHAHAMDASPASGWPRAWAAGATAAEELQSTFIAIAMRLLPFAMVGLLPGDAVVPRVGRRARLLRGVIGRLPCVCLVFLAACTCCALWLPLPGVKSHSMHAGAHTHTHTHTCT
jgi:hypothetical protein